MEPSPGLRPLTVRERVRTWGMGAVPSSILYIALKAVTYLLEDSDLPLWAYLVSGTPTVNLPLPLGEGGGIDIQLIFYLSRSFYVVAYFTWGRAFGHLLAGAYVVDRNTMQPMGLGRKLLRGLFTVATAPIFPFMDLLSLLMIYIDREQRRFRVRLGGRHAGGNGGFAAAKGKGGPMGLAGGIEPGLAPPAGGRIARVEGEVLLWANRRRCAR